GARRAASFCAAASTRSSSRTTARGGGSSRASGTTSARESCYRRICELVNLWICGLVALIHKFSNPQIHKFLVRVRRRLGDLVAQGADERLDGRVLQAARPEAVARELDPLAADLDLHLEKARGLLPRDAHRHVGRVEDGDPVTHAGLGAFLLRQVVLP